MVADGTDAVFDLTGRVALVTGGKCAEYASEITELTGRQAFPFGVHMGHWAEIGGLVDAAYDRFGRVDILVNNAGSSPLYDSLTDISEELFDKVIGVNLKVPFRLAALVGSRMAAAAVPKCGSSCGPRDMRPVRRSLPTVRSR